MRAAHLQHQSRNHRLDMALAARTEIPLRHRTHPPHNDETHRRRATRRRPGRTPTVLPQRRSRDRSQARHRRPGRQERSPARRRQHRTSRQSDAPLRHHDRNRGFHRQRRRQPQLLRPPQPRLRRSLPRPRFRNQTFLQSRRRRGTEKRTLGAELQMRAHHAGRQHRSIPAAREDTQSHTFNPRGAARATNIRSTSPPRARWSPATSTCWRNSRATASRESCSASRRSTTR